MGLSIDKFLVEKTASENEVKPTETPAEKTAEVEKTAADHALEVIDQAGTLVAVGESLQKFAGEDEDLAPLGAIGEDLFNIGSRMGAALSKTAAQEPYALADSLEIAEDLHKVASIFAEVADAMEDEDLAKDASAVIEITNILTKEANEFYEAMAEQEKANTAGESTEEKTASKAGEMLGKMKAKVMEKGKSAVHAAGEAKEKVKEHVKAHSGKYIAASAATGGTALGYMVGKHKK